MQINPEQVFQTLDGKHIEDPQNKKPLTLKDICVSALLGNYDEKIDGTEKVKRYMLATEIYKAKGNIDLSAEDISLLKKLIAIAFSTLVTGQAWEILDPKS